MNSYPLLKEQENLGHLFDIGATHNVEIIVQAVAVPPVPAAVIHLPPPPQIAPAAPAAPAAPVAPAAPAAPVPAAPVAPVPAAPVPAAPLPAAPAPVAPAAPPIVPVAPVVLPQVPVGGAVPGGGVGGAVPGVGVGGAGGGGLGGVGPGGGGRGGRGGRGRGGGGGGPGGPGGPGGVAGGGVGGAPGVPWVPARPQVPADPDPFPRGSPYANNGPLIQAAVNAIDNDMSHRNIRRINQGGRVHQPGDPNPFPNNDKWFKHLNHILYPGKQYVQGAQINLLAPHLIMTHLKLTSSSSSLCHDDYLRPRPRLWSA